MPLPAGLPVTDEEAERTLLRRLEVDISDSDYLVSDFTEGTHPISTKGTTQFSGAKRRSDLELFTLSLPLFSTLFFSL